LKLEALEGGDMRLNDIFEELGRGDVKSKEFKGSEVENSCGLDEGRQLVSDSNLPRSRRRGEGDLKEDDPRKRGSSNSSLLDLELESKP